MAIVIDKIMELAKLVEGMFGKNDSRVRITPAIEMWVEKDGKLEGQLQVIHSSFLKDDHTRLALDYVALPSMVLETQPEFLTYMMAGHISQEDMRDESIEEKGECFILMSFDRQGKTHMLYAPIDRSGEKMKIGEWIDPSKQVDPKEADEEPNKVEDFKGMFEAMRLALSYLDTKDPEILAKLTRWRTDVVEATGFTVGHFTTDNQQMKKIEEIIETSRGEKKKHNELQSFIGGKRRQQ